MHGPASLSPDIPRQAFLDAVKLADSPGEMKQRIVLARELGHLTDDETEDWIAMAGLREA